MSYRQSITNTNDTGAGSLRQVVADQPNEPRAVPARLTFTASGVIPMASPLVLDKSQMVISGGSQQVVLASTYDTAGGYILPAAASGISLQHLAVDMHASTGAGSGLLVGDGTSGLDQPYTNFTAKHCFIQGNGNDALGIVGRTRGLIYFEYCTFCGLNGDKSSLLAALPDYTSNPRVHVVFKHCLFYGGRRIPDITMGVVSLLGCVIVQRWQSGRMEAGARVNLVNNWMMSPNGGGHDVTPIGIPSWNPAYNGETLQDGAIYSRGNMLDGRDEADVGSNMYHYINGDGPVAASTFRSTPWGALPSVPDAATSRQLTLAYAGCYRNRSANDAAVIAMSAFRRPGSSGG